MIFFILMFFQPAEFNQLDHERRFKQVFFGILSGSTVYTLAVLSLNTLVSLGINCEDPKHKHIPQLCSR